MSDWISVEDRLPSETGQYIVYLKVGSIQTKLVVTTMRFQNREHNSKFMEGDWQKVINWMPLPEPPK